MHPDELKVLIRRPGCDRAYGSKSGSDLCFSMVPRYSGYRMLALHGAHVRYYEHLRSQMWTRSALMEFQG